MSPAGPSAAASAIIRQRFDFAASHRLHNPAMTEQENRACFGKCNNSAGHGHNYIIEPAVRIPVDGAASVFSHADLEDLCKRVILDRFDHKHLNVDTAEFGEGAGVLPTVENIAKVSYDLLAPAVAARCPAARLEAITVWETDRTSSTYPG
ncbi:MAG: 6-carboxytetrahydropterin synthase [Phycisphaerales bacterium]|nr:6-carboxytetrahydropterin synthase [Phycisphaerales bacterium]